MTTIRYILLLSFTLFAHGTGFRVIESTFTSPTMTLKHTYSYDKMGRAIKVDSIHQMTDPKTHKIKTFNHSEEIVQFDSENKALKIKYTEKTILEKLKKLIWSAEPKKLTLKDWQYQHNEFSKKFKQSTVYYNNISYDSHGYIKEINSTKPFYKKYKNSYDGDKLIKQDISSQSTDYIYNAKNQLIKSISKDLILYEYNNKNQLIKYNYIKKDKTIGYFHLSYNKEGALSDIVSDKIHFHYKYENKPCVFYEISASYNPLFHYINELSCKN